MVPLPLYEPQRSERSAGAMCGFTPHSFPPRKRGPRSRDGAAATRTDLSAANVRLARCAGSLPIRFPRESGGLGTAVVPLPQYGPQRSGFSAGTMLRLS